MKAINYALFLVFCGVAGTGLALEYHLESGGRGGALVAGLRKNQWEEIHLYLGLGLLVLSLVHLFINWSWVVKVATQQRRVVRVLTLGLGVLIFLAPLVLPAIPRSSSPEAGADGASNEAVKGPQVRARVHREDP
jgi:hypothetical protein